MATQSLQSRLGDLSMSLVNANRSNLLFGGTSKGEMDFLNNAGILQSATPNFLAFMAGAAASNNTIQEQRQQQFDSALRLWERQDSTEANRAAIDNTRAQTKLTGEQVRYYGQEANARTENLYGSAANSYANAGKTREETRFVAPLAAAEVGQRNSVAFLNTEQARQVAPNAASDRAVNQARASNLDATTEGQKITNRFMPQTIQSTINQTDAQARRLRADANIAEIDSISRNDANIAAINSTNAQSWASQFNANTNRINSGITAQRNANDFSLGIMDDGTRRYQINTTRDLGYANVYSDYYKTQSSNTSEAARLAENRRQFDAGMPFNNAQSDYQSSAAAMNWQKVNAPDFNPMQPINVSQFVKPTDKVEQSMANGLARMEKTGLANEIIREAQRQGVDPVTMLAMGAKESAGNVNARSPVGAAGVMQLMPDTAREVATKLGEEWRPNDVKQNIRFGTFYYKQQLDKYNRVAASPEQAKVLALAAYNAGAGNVDKYGGIPPFKETQDYAYYITKVEGSIKQGLDNSSIGNNQAAPVNQAATRQNTQAPVANQANTTLLDENFKLPKPELSSEEIMSLTGVKSRLAITEDDKRRAEENILSNPRLNEDKFVSIATNKLASSGDSDSANLSQAYERAVRIQIQIANYKKYNKDEIDIMRDAIINNKRLINADAEDINFMNATMAADGVVKQLTEKLAGSGNAATRSDYLRRNNQNPYYNPNVSF